RAAGDRRRRAGRRGGCRRRTGGGVGGRGRGGVGGGRRHEQRACDGQGGDHEADLQLGRLRASFSHTAHVTIVTAVISASTAGAPSKMLCIVWAVVSPAPTHPDAAPTRPGVRCAKRAGSAPTRTSMATATRAAAIARPVVRVVSSRVRRGRQLLSTAVD